MKIAGLVKVSSTKTKSTEYNSVLGLDVLIHSQF